MLATDKHSAYYQNSKLRTIKFYNIGPKGGIRNTLYTIRTITFKLGAR